MGKGSPSMTRNYVMCNWYACARVYVVYNSTTSRYMHCNLDGIYSGGSGNIVNEVAILLQST